MTTTSLLNPSKAALAGMTPITTPDRLGELIDALAPG